MEDSLSGGDSYLGGDSRVGGSILVETVWRLQRCRVFMFLRRPERIGWYLWAVLRSQLEEGADSEEELWVTDESSTEEEESDSGEFEEELFTDESDSEEGESDSGDGENEEREGSRETKREEERDLQRE